MYQFSVFRLVICLLFGLFSFASSAQEQGTKVSYPSGLRFLKELKNCSAPQWRKYDSGLEYVEVKAFAKHCQQFSDYLIPNKPRPNPGQQSGSWGTGSSSQKPTPGHVFLGNHYEIISETEIFVQVLSDNVSASELEQEVEFQCKEWVESLGKIEPSNKLPTECK
jgi:hypothetical protein